MSKIVRMMEYRRPPAAVYFNRAEMNQLLALYSRRVARGEWRDYGIRHDADMARFFIYRHAHERALFTIVKMADANTRRGPYMVFEGTKKRRQGHSLLEVLDVFEAPARLISG